MPLSRHFYSLDEVQATLLHTNSLFWCQELILSGCIAEAISTLFQSWLWNVGPINLQWLIDAWQTLALDEISEENNSITNGFKILGIENKNAFDSQALIQLKNDYCNQKRCLECAVGNKLLRPPSLFIY